MYEDEDLLVLDKPPGCPCSLHVSNALEVCGLVGMKEWNAPTVTRHMFTAIHSLSTPERERSKLNPQKPKGAGRGGLG